jgi:hypothetical protein
VREFLILGGAAYLNKRRGEQWIKEFEYWYIGLGVISIVSSVNRIDKLHQPWEKLDLVAPLIFVTAVVVKLIKTRAEIGRWHEFR